MSIGLAIVFVISIAILLGIHMNYCGNHQPPSEGPDNGPQEPPDDPFPFPGTDIYTSWALGAGRQDFFASPDQQEWIPLLLELEGVSAHEFAHGFLSRAGKSKPFISGDDEGQTWQSLVRVPGLYTGTAPLDGSSTPPQKLYLTAIVRAQFFGLFEQKNEGGFVNRILREIVRRSRLGSPLDAAALGDLSKFKPPAPKPTPREDVGPEPGTVVVGVIDDGIAFANERFRRAADKTRIEYLWLQGKYFDSSTASSDICNGREVKKNEIDDRLHQETHGGIVDEHAVYRHFGVEDFGRIRTLKRMGHKSTAQRTSHGAHVMDVAAGYPSSEARGDRPIIAVQLPTEVTAETSGGSLENYVLDAVQYILCRADEIAIDRDCGRLPVVINFSYGHYSGAHDGTSVSEEAFDQKIEGRDAPLRIVLPSGNSHLSRTHAQISFRPDDTPPVSEISLTWRVQPNDLTSSFLEVWLPRGAPSDRLEVKVKAPGNLGQLTLLEQDGKTVTFPDFPLPLSKENEKKVIFSISYKYVAESDRGFFLIKLQPTERIDPDDATVAPSGDWTVTLTNKSFDEDDLIHLWIQRDDTPLGYPIYGRQSYFDDPSYRRFLESGRPKEDDTAGAPVKRGGAINGIGTGDRTVVIAGIYRREMRAADYSSGGPTFDADRVGPDAAAVSEDTRVHRGILAAGTRSGSVVAVGGTSVAAPQITRWIADQLADGDPGDRTAVKNRAIIEESSLPARPSAPSHERGGAGRILRPSMARHDRYEP